MGDSKIPATISDAMESKNIDPGITATGAMYTNCQSQSIETPPPFLIDANTLFSIQKRTGALCEVFTLSYKSWKQIPVYDEHLPNRNFSIFNCANFTTLSQACQHL